MCECVIENILLSFPFNDGVLSCSYLVNKSIYLLTSLWKTIVGKLTRVACCVSGNKEKSQLNKRKIDDEDLIESTHNIYTCHGKCYVCRQI